MNYNKAVKVYTFTIPANGAFPLLVQSDYFRLQSATGAVDVSGDTFGTLPDLLTGQGMENTPYQRLVFTDKTGAPNTVSVLCSGDMFIDNRTYGVVTVSGAIELGTTTVNLLRRPEAHTGFHYSVAALAANTPETVFLAAANTGGAIILQASASDFGAISTTPVFLISSAAPPAGPSGGAAYLAAGPIAYDGAGNYCKGASMPEKQIVPAGFGLFFISAGAVSANGTRTCRYELL